MIITGPDISSVVVCGCVFIKFYTPNELMADYLVLLSAVLCVALIPSTTHTRPTGTKMANE